MIGPVAPAARNARESGLANRPLSPRSCRPDQQIEDPHLGEVVAPSYELSPGCAQRPAIEVEVALVAVDERERAFSEGSLWSEVIVGQVRLDDAVEHGDERGAFRMKSLRHLRETDPEDVCERVEELPQRPPGHQPSCPGQRDIGSNGLQCELDRPTALEDRRDLSRRDARASPVRQPQVGLSERGRGIADLEAPGLEVSAHNLQGIVNLDVASEADGRDRPRIHTGRLGASTRQVRAWQVADESSGDLRVLSNQSPFVERWTEVICRSVG